MTDIYLSVAVRRTEHHFSFLYYANSRAIQPGEMTTPESPKLVREERDTAGDLTRDFTRLMERPGG